MLVKRLPVALGLGPHVIKRVVHVVPCLVSATSHQQGLSEDIPFFELSDLSSLVSENHKYRTK